MTSYWQRLLIGAGISVAGHVLLASGAKLLPPPAPPAPPPELVPVAIVETKPAPAPEPIPDPIPDPEPPPAPPPEIAEPTSHPPPPATRTSPTGVTDEDLAPTERPSEDGEASTRPVFGVTMESTSQGGAGPAVPIGNTLRVRPEEAPPTPGRDVAPLPAPVPAHEVTKMPLPRGRCSGRYTEEAREAGVEGVVILDIVVGADGRVRDVDVVQGLDHGLTEAAVAAVKACRFEPGERAGEAVAVRIRAFKIRFLLDD